MEVSVAGVADRRDLDPGVGRDVLDRPQQVGELVGWDADVFDLRWSSTALRVSWSMSSRMLGTAPAATIADTASPADARVGKLATKVVGVNVVARRRRRVAAVITPSVSSEPTNNEVRSSMARARAALDRVQFAPHVLRDVTGVDPSTTILGRQARLPLVLAPTGLTKAVHHEGEIAVARAARDAGVPYALSTMGSTSIEELAATAPTADKWFQLYLWRDRAASKALLERSAASGYSTLILTVDVPVAGGRLRDQRNCSE